MNLGIILVLILVFGVVMLLMVTKTGKKPGPRKGGHHREVLNRKDVQERWTDIENTFNLGGESRFKSAILDADKLMDHVLKGLNIAGDSMGDRLKNAKKKFSNYDDYNNLWFAHKVRNNIAHEMNHDLNSAEAKRAMGYYKKALKVLGVL